MTSRLDSHQHFWKFDPIRDAWIDESMKVIQRDFLPTDLEPILVQNGITGCVAVQADQSADETDFLLSLADDYTFIKGVVGWIDFEAKNIDDQLTEYKRFTKLRGFRHILQGEKQRDYMLRPAFLDGVSKLKRHGYTYDILIFPDQLSYALKFVREFPDQPFVVDHLAKPYIRSREIEQWRKDMSALARYEHVCCKVSGMITEADWKMWKREDLYPYLDAVVESFGTERLMFGSDWPVCLVAGSYEDVLDVVEHYFAGFSNEEREGVFGGNAVRFYNL